MINLKINKKIINKINVILNTKEISLWVTSLSKQLSIPEKVINFYIKKKFFQNYIYKKQIFNKKIYKNYSFIYFLSLIVFLIYCLFKRHKINKKKAKIIIVNANSSDTKKAYSKIAKSFSNSIIYLNEDNNYKYQFISLSQLFEFCKIIFNSIFNYNKNFNKFYFLYHLFRDIIIWDNLFNDLKARIILQHQYDNSNIIKNYFFRKRYGKIFLIQKNINTLNSNGFFFDADGIFTMSKNVAIKKNKTFSNFERTYEVGSFFLENSLNKIDKQIYPDILFLGGNALHPNGYYDTYYEYKKDYETILNWLKHFSIEHPEIKIYYKDHSTKKKEDNFERKILEGSRVIFINQKLNSYAISKNSKFICSWASTMIVEMTSLKKYCYFLNPGGRNSQFLENIDNSQLLSLKSYNEFKKAYFRAKKLHFKTPNIRQIYCLNSKHTSRKIYKILLKNLNANKL